MGAEWLCAIILRMSSMKNEPLSDLEQLVCLAVEGDKQALATLFDHYRRRLRKMVRLRLDRRLQSRVDRRTCSKKRFSVLTNRK